MRASSSPFGQLPLLERLAQLLLMAVVATSVFAVAYDGGGYSTASRGMWAIAVWWLLGLMLVLGWWHPFVLDRLTAATAGALAGVALFTLASVAWAVNDARAFAEFNRVSFYLGAFLAVAVGARRMPLGRWCDGIAVGITAVVLVALLSRLAPALISDRGLAEGLPAASARLSFPVGYWNGLAILAALAVPLLLRAASATAHPVPRGLAAAPLPAIAATVYLASSRGGVATAAIGTLVLLVAGRHRWSLVSACAAGLCGFALVAWALDANPAVVDQPLQASTADRLEVTFALLIGCVLASLLHSLSSALLASRRPPQWVNAAAILVALGLATGALVGADLGQRVDEFTTPPAIEREGSASIRSHLVSVSGSGRWQLWASAVDAWGEKPLHGHGAGSYEAWWAQHGTLPVFTRDAHSLSLETLAELGLAGLALLACALVFGAIAIVRRLRELERDAAHDTAAATAAFAGFVVAAQLDWIWELPALALVGFGCLALAMARPQGPLVPRPRERGERITGAASLAVAASLIVAQSIPFLADASIRQSQSAASRGDSTLALSAARRAVSVQSWAPEPWLQLALVHEQGGRLRMAEHALSRALAADAQDWRLWLTAARVETKLGEVVDARRSLRRAIELNPRSRLLGELR